MTIKIEGLVPSSLKKSSHEFYRLRYCVVLACLAVAGCATEEQRSASPAHAAVAPSTASLASSKSSAAEAEAPVRIPINGLTLQGAVGIAVSRHPDISRANAVVDQSRSEVAIAKAEWYPTVEYGIRPGYAQNSGRDGGAVRGSIGVNQPIYDFGRTSSRISAAEATLSKQQYLLADTAETVAYNMAQTFVELAASQEMIAAAEKQAATLRETESKIAERVKAGLSNASDQNQADVAVQRAEVEVLKGKTRFDVAAGKFAELSGVRPQRVAGLSATGKLVDALGGKGGNVDRTPAVLAAEAAMDAARAKLKLAKAERFPAIGLGVSRALSNNRYNTDDSTWVGISLSGSFSTGGSARHRIAAAEAERQAAAQMLENERLVTNSALNSAETEAAGATARLASYDKMIALSLSSRDLYWQEYTLNKRPLTEVINAEREIYLAEVERIIAVGDGILAKIKAHVATGDFIRSLRGQKGKRT